MTNSGGATSASLLASPDLLRVAWLHLFASSDPDSPRPAWDRLWPEAKKILSVLQVPSVWAMTPLGWMIDLLWDSGFTRIGQVVAYSQKPSRPVPESGCSYRVVPLMASDLPEVEQADHAAFDAPWQLDSDALRETLRRSSLATVLRMGGRIAGYLMAVNSPHGVHLSRLAVHPEFQNRGIGRALLIHMLNYFLRLGAPRITVNTQVDNDRSQRLYAALGFRPAGESYPVFCAHLTGP